MADQSKANPHRNAVAGIIAGFISSLAMHPLDVITTRMQAHDSRISNYKNVLESLVSIARKEGMTRLYAGVVPNIVGSMTNWGVYFYGYNYARNQARAYLNKERDPNSMDEPRELGAAINLLCATTIGCISAVVTQPLWLAKTRMQLQDTAKIQYRSMRHCLLTVAQEEGFRSLFK
jgi:solute carrier family 25 (mitochondrial folate transporter), member 32